MASGGARESGIASASAASSPPSTPSDHSDEATPRLKNAWSQVVRGPSSPARSKAEPPRSPQPEEQNERLHPHYLSSDAHSRVSDSLIKEDLPSDTITTAVKPSPISSSDNICSPGVERKQFSRDALFKLPIASPDKLINDSAFLESIPTQQSPVKSPKPAWGKLAANAGLNPEPEPVMGAVAWPALSEARNTKTLEQSKSATTQKAVPKTSLLSSDYHHSQAPPLSNREVGGLHQTMPVIVNAKPFNQVTGNGNSVSEAIPTITASPSKGVQGTDADQLKRGGGKETRLAAASEVHQRGNATTSQVSSHDGARSLMWDQGRGNHSFPVYGRGYTSPRDSNVSGHQRGGHRNVPQPFVPFVAPNPGFVPQAGFPNVPGSMYYIPAPVSEPLLGATYFVPPPVQGVFMHGPDPITLQGLVVKQIEYYFSVENLCRDIYLRSKMDEQGYVPVSVIANFNRVRMITQNPFLIIEALRMSNVVEVQGDKVRKKGDWANWILPDNQQSAGFLSSVVEDQVNHLSHSSHKSEGADYRTNDGVGPSNGVGDEISESDLMSELSVQNVVEDPPSQHKVSSCDDERMVKASVEEEAESKHFTQSCSIESGHRID